MTADQAPFVLWTVYDNPTDFPGLYVARQFTLNGPTKNVFTSESLGALRAIFQQRGMTPMPRSPGDDPVIIESWI